ncbi:hypothetical protein C2845_PM17G14300 [Panicum miliaceum]|uniref:Uncharacterized protein n=1 Tax=Panicum miliaceum TaxID=4540 RepID=A0A3L6Q2N4_PANMI|nr:hypothetical protein C2845_PM17G14300 [Panicum miliaceum]
MNTQCSIASLLARLTIVLVNEALLLGAVRAEVEFIKDELECMNSCLLQLTEAQHRNHQVVELTHNCEANIELYVHYVRGGLPGHNGKGILGYFRRMPQFLGTIRVRHRIATRIRELMVRAHDIGERWLRYGVTVPTSGTTDTETQYAGKEEELRRHTLLEGAPPDEVEVVSKGIDILIKRLLEEAPPAPSAEDDSGLRVFPILGDWYAAHLDDIAQGVYKHPLVNSSFDCEAWVNVGWQKDVGRLLANILKELTSLQPCQEDEDEEQFIRKLQECLKVSNSDIELAGISQLLKLRKFGVALLGKNAKLNDLFHEIGKLHRSLRSLSIRIYQLAARENHDAWTVDALAPPQFIRSLNISGLTSGLPHLIQELHRLVKLTLTETYLKEDALRILGKLHGLRCLRLQHKSYTKNELSFEEEEFQTLRFLLVGSSNITKISFVTRAAPKVERIVWSFPATARLTGVGHLHELKEFELNGNCNPDQMQLEEESMGISSQSQASQNMNSF